MPGHRRRCCRCGAAVKAKMCNAYVSWYVGDDRTTYYTRWSIDCFADAIMPVIETSKEADANGGGICIVCGEKIEGDPEIVFMTLFPPKLDQVDYEFETCPTECWPKLRHEPALRGVWASTPWGTFQIRSPPDRVSAGTVS